LGQLHYSEEAIEVAEHTEDVVGRDPLLGVSGEHLLDEVLGARRNAWPRVAGEVDLPPQDGVEDAVLGL
jgi:hypothetical protein